MSRKTIDLHERHCPLCGGALMPYVLTCIPPITEYHCMKCGYRYGSTEPDHHQDNRVKSDAAYEQGEWDMFQLITSAWYGKQCYFQEDNGIVYSRLSNKYLTVDQAYTEFLGQIGDNGDY